MAPRATLLATGTAAVVAAALTAAPAAAAHGPKPVYAIQSVVADPTATTLTSTTCVFTVTVNYSTGGAGQINTYADTGAGIDGTDSGTQVNPPGYYTFVGHPVLPRRSTDQTVLFDALLYPRGTGKLPDPPPAAQSFGNGPAASCPAAP